METIEDLAFRQMDILPGMAQRDVIVVCNARRNRKQIQTPQRAYGCVKSRRLLGMLRTRYMLFAKWIRGKPRHYLPNSSKPNEPGTILRRGRPLVSPSAGGSI